MTKEEYLNKLREELKNDNVAEIDDIVTKYESRFKLANEAGFSEDEAIAKFGDPKSVADSYKAEVKKAEVVDGPKDTASNNGEESYHNEGKYTIVLSLVADDIKVVTGDNDHIAVNFNDASPDDYVITADDKARTFKLEFMPKSKFFSKMHRSHLSISLPKNMPIDSFRIKVVSSTVELGDMVADNISVSTVSGKIEAGDIRGKRISFNMVSGNVNINYVAADTLDLSTVSGSLKGDAANINTLKVNGVSGSVTFDKGTVNSVKSSILSGKVIINGESRK